MTATSAKPSITQLAAAPPKAALQPKGLQPKTPPARTWVRRRTVRFVLEVPSARNVSVVGTFNQWNPGTTPLRCRGGIKWFTYVSLPLGRHEYRFVVDGKGVDEPTARKYVPNPSGGKNAVIVVE